MSSLSAFPPTSSSRSRVSRWVSIHSSRTKNPFVKHKMVLACGVISSTFAITQQSSPSNPFEILTRGNQFHEYSIRFWRLRLALCFYMFTISNPIQSRAFSQCPPSQSSPASHYSWIWFRRASETRTFVQRYCTSAILCPMCMTPASQASPDEKDMLWRLRNK
jgi:hypothetical protein